MKVCECGNPKPRPRSPSCLTCASIERNRHESQRVKQRIVDYLQREQRAAGSDEWRSAIDIRIALEIEDAEDGDAMSSRLHEMTKAGLIESRPVPGTKGYLYRASRAGRRAA